MFRDVVTVFNFHEPSGLWHTTVFKNCDLREARADRRTAGSGEVNESKVTLLINVKQDKSAHTIIYEPNRIVDNLGNGLLSGDRVMLSYTDPDTSEVKRYAGPKAYAQLENPGGFFTFKPACDFMAAGKVNGGDERLAVYPELDSGNRVIKSISRTSPAHIGTAYQDGVDIHGVLHGDI